MREYRLKHILQQNKLDIHVEIVPLNEDFAIHTHNFCELVFIISGSGKHIVGDTEYELKKGDIFIIKGNEKHGFSNVRDLKLCNIMFNVYDLMIEDCRNLTGFWVLFVHEQTSDFFSHITVDEDAYYTVLHWCELLLKEYTNHQPGYISVCHSVLIQLIVFLSRTYQELDHSEEYADFRLAKSIVYMQTNFSSKITVDQLAKMAGFSPRHFSRLFQQVYSISPIQFLNEIRLSHAQMLLESGNHKVTEVASLCGFQDGNYFSRVFKQKYNVAPSEWK